MPGQPVRIGPFLNGMNIYSGPSTIADNEAVNILNMDVDLDGSLVSRPGVTLAAGPGTFATHIIGTYRAKTGEIYIIYSGGSTLRAYNTSTNTWTGTLATGQTYTSCVQFNDFLYVTYAPVGTAVGGGKWDPVNGFQAVPNMPRGYDSCIYKERMFVSASRNNDTTSINRIKFSNAADPDTWTSTDYFDVSAGDGDDITAIRVFDSSIVVFKGDATYIFAYESAPAKGLVQKVSAAVGANNRYSVVEYENNLFVMHRANVYRISNWNWEQTNIKVPFVYRNVYSLGNTDKSSLSLLGNRLLVRYYDKYYCLGLKTGAWTEWDFSMTPMAPGEFVPNPNINASAGTANYYAGTYVNTYNHLYLFVDGKYDTNETFKVRLVSKSYDFGPSYSFKRLYWWGVDLLFGSATTFKVIPNVYNVPVKWGDIIGKNESQLGTWGRPLDISLDVTDTAVGNNAFSYRTFVKLLKGLRFRQLQFTIEATYQGLNSLAAYRIFSLTAFVDSKENVSKKVS